MTPAWTVPYIRPRFPDSADLAADLDRIVGANWYTNFGPIERQFAARLEDWLDCGRRVTPVANATSGLMAAIRLHLPSERPGLVLVASYTFAAGPAAIRWGGHRPLFIDIDPVTLQPSLESALQAFIDHGSAIVGILLTNSFGIGNPEVRSWEALADAVGVPLIVDSAAGFGSRYTDGQRVGSAGVCEVFSFHATKPFAVGEGGAVAHRDPADDERMRSLINFGFVNHDATRIGFNGKLQELNAAIGLRQLDRFEHALATRRATLATLEPHLTEAGLTLPPHQDSSAVSATIVLADDTEIRDRTLAQLHAAGVEARVYYAPAVHEQAAFRDELRADELPGTTSVGRRVLALPVHDEMEASSVDLIADAVADHRRSVRRAS